MRGVDAAHLRGFRAHRLDHRAQEVQAHHLSVAGGPWIQVVQQLLGQPLAGVEGVLHHSLSCCDGQHAVICSHRGLLLLLQLPRLVLLGGIHCASRSSSGTGNNSRAFNCLGGGEELQLLL